jgi:hypothetical protein
VLHPAALTVLIALLVFLAPPPKPADVKRLASKGRKRKAAEPPDSPHGSTKRSSSTKSPPCSGRDPDVEQQVHGAHVEPLGSPHDQTEQSISIEAQTANVCDPGVE